MFAAWDPKPELSYLTSLANLPLQLVLFGINQDRLHHRLCGQASDRGLSARALFDRCVTDARAAGVCSFSVTQALERRVSTGRLASARSSP